MYVGDVVQLAVGHVAPGRIRCIKKKYDDIHYVKGDTIEPIPSTFGIYVCMYLYICMCIYVCMCVCMYLWVCV